MDADAKNAINDLIDAVAELTRLVEELNHGATAQLDQIKFFVNRADRTLKQADVPHGQ